MDAVPESGMKIRTEYKYCSIEAHLGFQGRAISLMAISHKTQKNDFPAFAGIVAVLSTTRADGIAWLFAPWFLMS
jgi:uncharacterized membrane protein YsdA (DUF1294 family)